MHSEGVIRHGFKLVQAFLMDQYWRAIFYQIEKRDSLLSQAYSKIGDFKVHKSKMPGLVAIKDDAQRQKLVSKLVKSNLKFPKRLDPCQLAQLINFFVDKLLFLITISFQDYSHLSQIIKSFDTTQAEKEMSQLVIMTFKQKSELLCFVHAFQVKFSNETVSHMINISVLTSLVQTIMDSLQQGHSKESCERCLKLISVFQLLNSVLQCSFGRLTHLTSDFSLLGLYRAWDQVISLANVDIFAFLMRKKA